MSIIDQPSPTPVARYRPELNWRQIIHSEIVSVTSAMRRNQRWHQNETLKFEPQFKESTGIDKVQGYLNTTLSRTGLGAPFPAPTEHPLLFGFTLLKSNLSSVSSTTHLIRSSRFRSVEITGSVSERDQKWRHNWVNYRSSIDIGSKFHHISDS